MTRVYPTAIAVLAIVTAASQTALAQRVTLNRAACSTLTAGTGWTQDFRVLDLRASRDFLYVLLVDASGKRARIAVVSPPNSLAHHIDISGVTRGFSLAPSGEVAIQTARSPGDPWKIDRYDTAGKYKETLDVGPGMSPFWMNGSTVYGFDSAGRLARVTAGKLTYVASAASISQQHAFQDISPTSIAIVDRVTATLQVVDAAGSLAALRTLRSPEIDFAQRKQAEELNRWNSQPESVKTGRQPGKMHAIFAPSSDMDGSLFVLVSGFLASEGMTCLRIAEDGRIVNRYALSVLNTGLKIEDGKPFFPSFTAVLKQSIYALDHKGNMCSYALR